MKEKRFDIIVIGGGHAGLEAAWSASQFQFSIGIFTIPEVSLGSMPCNPAIGGVGKGQIVREIDALGGLMGILADKAAIQYRLLNESKGYAVRSTRVQVDKKIYSAVAEKLVAENPCIEVVRQKIVHIEKKGSEFKLFTESKQEFKCLKLVVTAGTFLGGVLHTGDEVAKGGRVSCQASPGMRGLFSSVKTLPVRFKTGTPPRLDRNSIDFDNLIKQPSRDDVLNFHCLNPAFFRHCPQAVCYLTETNEKTLKIIRENKEKSPMFNGQIKGVGPRYCPSLEDKAFRYLERNRHHVFLEPEGLDLPTIYPNGISTGLPKSIQEKFVRTIPGLDRA
ncbi:MAG: FAD-dependent oxidoreductase, partial [Halobacteriovoraceae bacterium]|nr:FAD-dependent oxidoreductase [Halobacteriovoraceae bacterium]